MKKAQKAMAEESTQRLQEFEEKKEMELVNMKADEASNFLSKLLTDVLIPHKLES